MGLVPGLKRVTMVGLDLDGRVFLMHLLFSIRVNVYLTHRRLFACRGEISSEGLPPVVYIHVEALPAWRSVCAVPRVNHVTRLGKISLLDCQTKPCERAAKSTGTEYVELDFRGLNFVPPDCAYWILQREVDRPLNVFEMSPGLFPLITD